MPHAFVQFEKRFEPLVEWFGGLLAPSVESSAARALQELVPLLPALATASPAHIGRRFQLASNGIAGISRTQKTPTGASAAFVVFDPFSIFIDIVTAVRRYRAGGRRQLNEFLSKGARFTGPRGVTRSEQRK